MLYQDWWFVNNSSIDCTITVGGKCVDLNLVYKDKCKGDKRLLNTPSTVTDRHGK